MPLFLRWDDDAADDDVLAEYKHEESGDRGDDECGVHHVGAGSLLHLIEMNHHGPHIGILTQNERHHEIPISNGEGVQADHCQDRLRSGHCHVPEHRPFGGAIQARTLIELAR